MRASRLAWLLALALAVSAGAEGAEPPKTQKVKVGITKPLVPRDLVGASVLDEALKTLPR